MNRGILFKRNPPVGNLSRVKKFVWFVFAVAIVGGTFYASRFFTTRTEEIHEGERPKQPVQVEVAAADIRAMREIRSFPGSVDADETVAITPKVTGVILKIDVQLGDEVAVGDPLVEIDDSEFVKRLRQAQANLELTRAVARRSETTYALAQREYERIKSAHAQGLATDQELDSALASRESSMADTEVARAEVARTEASVEEAELNVQNARIHSPMNGRVQARYTDPGALASPSSPILTIVDVDPAKIVIYLPERDLMLARIGETAEVTVSDGQLKFTGLIARVSPGLRETSRTAEVVIDVPNKDNALRPGMSADIALTAREEPNALAVPTDALIFQRGGMEVYLVENGVARAVPVKVGIEVDGFSQITEGLTKGDEVVVKGQFLLRDGQEVTYAGMTPRSASGDRNTD